MAADDDAQVPKLDRELEILTRTIQELALLVGMRFVVNVNKVKAFKAGTRSDQTKSDTDSASHRIAAG